MSKQANSQTDGATGEAGDPDEQKRKALALGDDSGAAGSVPLREAEEGRERTEDCDEGSKTALAKEVSESSGNRSSDHASHADGHDTPLTRLGPYKVLKLIGEGEAAVVYHAEEEEPAARQVALKLIKKGKNWEAVFDRFQACRNVWSRLDDPHIARVLDVGRARSGQPFLVAQWVNGVPITQYCDGNSLSTRQRLDLFVAVCKAVQFAHQKGVFHGCLKPSNVFVVDDHEQATPMVLDFGWRQAVREDAVVRHSDAPITAASDLVYLSPEQVDANAEGIDARSDVYSLGVLLYELLTGDTPMPANRLEGVPARNGMQLLRTEEIPPPSERIKTLKKQRPSSDEKQQHQSSIKGLKGELDCVVLKALQKNPACRYETAADLARDIQRHLAGEPTQAFPASAMKRLWKASRRHKAITLAVALGFFALLTAAAGGIGLAAWATVRVEHAENEKQQATERQNEAEEAQEDILAKFHRSEAARKDLQRRLDSDQQQLRANHKSLADEQAVLSFLESALLAAGRPADVSLVEAYWKGTENHEQDMSLLKAADEAAAKVANAFPGRPHAEATARQILGTLYLNLGKPKRAVPQYEQALELRQGAQGFDSTKTADCRNKLAIAYRLAGRTDDASQLFQQNPASASEAEVNTLKQKLQVAQRSRENSQNDQQKKVGGESNSWTTFELESRLGAALVEQKKYDEAEKHLLSAYHGLKDPQEHGSSEVKECYIKTLERLVLLYERWGQSDKATKYLDELGKATARDC